MTYVEWLRVRNFLRVLAIVLGVLIAISLVLRISFNSEISRDDVFIHNLQKHPGTTETHQVLPDGTRRTTINDPSESTVVTIDTLGDGGRNIVVSEPLGRHNSSCQKDHVMLGSIDVRCTTQGDRAITTIATDNSTPFLFYMMVADVTAFIVATLLAAPFARENDGHLEIALTKPISREAFAVGTMLVDVAGVVLASAMTVVALIICQAMFEVPHPDFSGVSFDAILMGIAAPLAWYGFLNAITSSLKRGYGAILGFAWPVAILITVLSIIPWGDSILGQLVHNVFWVISRADPLSYVGSVGPQSNGELTAAPNFGLRLTIEFALFVIYSALAVFQWKRVEA